MPIKLHKFGEVWGIPDPSPFCVKVESFLREAGIAYKAVRFEGRRSFARAPKGKLSFIEEEDGAIVGDSTLIIARLSKQRGIDMDEVLDDWERCISLAFRRMLDEHFYWVGVYSRWIDEPGWSAIRNLFFARIPGPLRPFAITLARGRVRAALHAQGIGRHSRDEIYAFGLDDMSALSRLLGDDTYFFAAKRPTLLDLWAHAFVAENDRAADRLTAEKRDFGAHQPQGSLRALTGSPLLEANGGGSPRRVLYSPTFGASLKWLGRRNGGPNQSRLAVSDGPAPAVAMAGGARMQRCYLFRSSLSQG